MDGKQRQHMIWLACLGGGIILSSLLVLEGLTASRASAAAVPELPARMADEILTEPRHFLWRDVAVDGEVGRSISGRAFALRSRTVRQGLLVVLDEPAASAAPTVSSGRPVEVRGTVHVLTRQEVRALKKRLGVDLDSLLATHGNHPYILALEVRPCPTAR